MLRLLRVSPWVCLASCVGALLFGSNTASAQTAAESQLVTWYCTGSPCPWGPQDSGQALVWPSDLQPVNIRLGYTVSDGVYLPAASANGLTVSIQTGSAVAYAGLPGAGSFRVLASIAPGAPYQIWGLAAAEVVTVQSSGSFSYELIAPTSPEPDPEPPGSDESPSEPPGSPSSVFVTWTCTGSPCPWGSQDAGQALAWPSDMQPVNNRLGYTVSDAIYLPASSANGVTVSILTGTATAYAGRPDDTSFRILGTINAGQSYVVSGLAAGEVVTVQSASPFSYQITPADPNSAPSGGDPADPDDPGDPETPPAPAAGPTSVLVTWTCTGSPCPWGSPITGQALVWPSDAQPVNNRLGYTVSGAIYLPAGSANGMTIALLTGTATVYAGRPDDTSFRILGTINSGQPYLLSGLSSGEVMTVQSADPFTYQITLPDPNNLPEDGDPGDPGDPEPPPANSTSVLVTWTCTGSPCPWGSQDTGQALVWPSDMQPVDNRLGYTVSSAIYLPAISANGLTIAILNGSATAYAGLPDAGSFRLLATIAAGQSYVVSGLSEGEVLTVQGPQAFTYAITPPAPVDPAADPADGVDSQAAFWQCNIPDCQDGPWRGAVISWPSWSAYESNARSGLSSRTVYSEDGQLLYPYMGAWANGCEVTAQLGQVLIIEWRRGTDTWRETLLEPGQTHVISLLSWEDGAMIESLDGPGRYFRVSLNNCNPQPVPRQTRAEGRRYWIFR